MFGNGSNGSRRARRSEVGETTTGVDGDGAPEDGSNSGLPSSNPDEGSSWPVGGVNRNEAPEGVVSVSVRGLKEVDPA